jgi:ABC-2 type transport system permease protein
MFARCLKAERIKLLHSPIWLAFLLVPVLPAIMGTFNYTQNLEVLQDGWYSLWSQHTLFSCYFFIPALIGVYASYLWNLEHGGDNWNAVLASPVPYSYVYLVKFFLISCMTALSLVWIGFLFIVSGLLIGLPAAFPPELFIWLLSGLLGGLAICAIQLLLSLILHSFAVPVGLSILGGIGGLLALAKGIGVWFPYSLVSIGMLANDPEGEMACSGWQFVLHCLFFILLFSVLAILRLQKKDAPGG